MTENYMEQQARFLADRLVARYKPVNIDITDKLEAWKINDTLHQAHKDHIYTIVLLEDIEKVKYGNCPAINDIRVESNNNNKGRSGLDDINSIFRLRIIISKNHSPNKRKRRRAVKFKGVREPVLKLNFIKREPTINDNKPMGG